jgi:endogenous inhibitor of DNA gyrase (YacG/DUF329 family)
MGDSQKCVVCRTRPIDPRWRPFCSERCRNEDLARWSDERYRVTGDPVPASQAEDDN